MKARILLLKAVSRKSNCESQKMAKDCSTLTREKASNHVKFHVKLPNSRAVER